jgi:hypothetical protein
MRTIEMTARVDEQGKMLLELPSDVPPGEYRIVVVFANREEASLTVQPTRTPKPPLKVHIFEWEGWPKDATFSREELYDDVEY